MPIVKLNKDVPLECKYLDNNIEEHIFKYLKDNMNRTCSFNNGYILDVKRIISLGDNKVSSANSLAIFKVSYEAETLKPVVGTKLSGNVCMVLKNGDGIMVDICNIMQLLIPSHNMKPFVYKNNSFDLTNKDGSVVSIKTGSDINLEVVASKYEKKKYSCIGKIII